MNLNARKCASLVIQSIPSLKKTLVVTRPVFSVDGVDIPPVLPGHFFKYLGNNYSHMGVTLPDISEFSQQLNRVGRAPLKPHQKLFILKRFLLPRYIYALQNPKITRDILSRFDRLSRVAVRKWLHLPRTCASSYIHAHTRDGGLGVFSAAIAIPPILLARLQSLPTSDSDIAALSATAFFDALTGRLISMSPAGVSKTERRNHWRSSLEGSFSGNGIHQGGSNGASGSWISRPPPFWTGREYCRAIQLRGNLLPTVGLPSNPPEARRCRAGCERVESLSHVLQRCPATHWSRIARHDGVVRLLRRAAEARGWTVRQEPHIRDSAGLLRKPDLVFAKGDAVVVSDVAIHWEGPRLLSSAAADKEAHYSTPPFLAALSAKHPPGVRVSVLPFILGARGIWAVGNGRLMDALGLPASFAHTAVTFALKGSLLIHTDFGRRVFSRRAAR